jgi:hypothetical protein
MNQFFKYGKFVNINLRSLNLNLTKIHFMKYNMKDSSYFNSNLRHYTNQAKNSKQEFVLNSKAKSLRAIIGVACIWVAFIYFGFLRESNEIDDFLNSLNNVETAPQVKIMAIRKKIQEYEMMGLSTSSLKNDLKIAIEKATGK